MRKITVLIIAMIALTGCSSLEIGPKNLHTQDTRILDREWKNVTANLTFALWEEHDGNFVKAGSFGRAKNPGEIVSLDVWPVAGAAIGVLGARIRIMPFEVGFGFLGYDPKPSSQTDEGTDPSNTERKPEE